MQIIVTVYLCMWVMCILHILEELRLGKVLSLIDLDLIDVAFCVACRLKYKFDSVWAQYSLGVYVYCVWAICFGLGLSVALAWVVQLLQTVDQILQGQCSPQTPLVQCLHCSLTLMWEEFN